MLLFPWVPFSVFLVAIWQGYWFPWVILYPALLLNVSALSVLGGILRVSCVEPYHLRSQIRGFFFIPFISLSYCSSWDFKHYTKQQWGEQIKMNTDCKFGFGKLPLSLVSLGFWLCIHHDPVGSTPELWRWFNGLNDRIHTILSADPVLTFPLPLC